MTTMTLPRTPGAGPVDELLREWRRRRISQLDLSIQADISTRHLSFVETGRSRPTPEMILRLTEQLDVPLRERNALLLAGGYAPAYLEHGLDEPELQSVRAALRQVLAGHEPYPAVLVNRWWEMLDSNAAIAVLVDGCAPWLLDQHQRRGRHRDRRDRRGAGHRRVLPGGRGNDGRAAAGCRAGSAARRVMAAVVTHASPRRAARTGCRRSTRPWPSRSPGRSPPARTRPPPATAPSA